MEFWILILTHWAFYVWVQLRIRRRKEDERFRNVINALNRLEPRLNDLKNLETRVAELEHRLASGVSQVPPSGRGRDLQVHHLVTRGQLGSNTEQNLITLCASCHQRIHSDPWAKY